MASRLDHYAVKVDANVIHIEVGPEGDFHSGTHIALILPHIRGVGALVAPDRYDHVWTFPVYMYDSKTPIIIYGNTHMYLEASERSKVILGMVRHDVLSAINGYYHRPYSGEQLSLL